MNTIIAQKQRYLPHTLETKYHEVKTYRSGCSIRFVWQFDYTNEKIFI